MFGTLKQIDLNQNVKERNISWYIPQVRKDPGATSLYPHFRRNQATSVLMALPFCA